MAIISRRQYDHPALATAGGSALHASITNLYTVLGDDLMSRYKAFSAVANSSVGVIAHEFGLDFANLKVQIFTGTYPALTLVSDPIGSGWTVAATSGLASRSIDVTAPASGGPHTYAVLVSHESNASQYIPGLVSIGTQTFAGAKTFAGTLFGTDTTDSSSSTTGAFKTAGGLGVAKALYVGTSITSPFLVLTGNNPTILNSVSTGQLVISGGSTAATSGGGQIAFYGSGDANTGLLVIEGSNQTERAGTNNAVNFNSYSAVNTEITAGYFTGAGAWTWGAATNTPYTSFHTTHKSIFSAPTNSNDSSGTFYIGTNAYIIASGQPTRQTGLSGVAINMGGRTSNTTDVFNVVTNLAGDGPTTGATSILAASSAGAWTWGATNQAHNIKGTLALNGTNTSPFISFTPSGNGSWTSGIAYIQAGINSTGATDGTNLGFLVPPNIGFTWTNSTIVMGQASSAGAWTLGASTTNAQHTIQSIAGAGTLDLSYPGGTGRTGLSITQNAATVAYIMAAGSISDIVTGSAVGDLTIRTTNNLLFGVAATKVGGYTLAGAWTWGASGSVATTQHIVNGSMKFTTGGAFNTGDSIRFNSNTMHIHCGTSGFRIPNSSNSQVNVEVLDSGACTLGDSARTSLHTINGQLKIDNSAGDSSLEITDNSDNIPRIKFTCNSTQDMYFGATAANGPYGWLANNNSTVLGQFTQAGAWTFPLIHNLGAGNITSGRWTSTLTNGANVTGSPTFVSSHYSRIGNTVTCCGYISVATSAAANTRTVLAIDTLPIATTFTATSDAQGVCNFLAASGTASSAGGAERGTGNKVNLTWNSTQTGADLLYFSFQYEVK